MYINIYIYIYRVETRWNHQPPRRTWPYIAWRSPPPNSLRSMPQRGRWTASLWHVGARRSTTKSPGISVDLGEVKALSHVVLLWGEFSPSRYFIQGTDGQRMGDIVFFFKCFFSPFAGGSYFLLNGWVILWNYFLSLLVSRIFKPCSALYKSGFYMILSENWYPISSKLSQNSARFPDGTFHISDIFWYFLLGFPTSTALNPEAGWHRRIPGPAWPSPSAPLSWSARSCRGPGCAGCGCWVEVGATCGYGNCRRPMATDLENWHVFQGEKHRGRDRKHI